MLLLLSDVNRLHVKSLNAQRVGVSPTASDVEQSSAQRKATRT